MQSKDWRLRIEDILESISAIQKYIEGADFQSFAAAAKTVDAVVRRFTIIGEAANHVPSEVTVGCPSIPWRKMRQMRNVVVHAYSGVICRLSGIRYTKTFHRSFRYSRRF
jgi:uncharacterized protein with HEPN domain